MHEFERPIDTIDQESKETGVPTEQPVEQWSDDSLGIKSPLFNDTDRPKVEADAEEVSGSLPSIRPTHHNHPPKNSFLN